MKRQKFIAELSTNGMVILRSFEKSNLYHKQKRGVFDSYSRYKNNRYYVANAQNQVFKK